MSSLLTEDDYRDAIARATQQMDPALVTEPPGTPTIERPAVPVASASPTAPEPRLPASRGGPPARILPRESATDELEEKYRTKKIWAGIADVFGAMGGKNPGYSVALRGRIDAERESERRAVIDEQKLQLERLKLFSQMEKDAFDIGKSALTMAADFAKNSPGATDQERTAAATSFFRLAQKAGVPIDEAVFHGMVRNPEIAKSAGDLLPFLEDGGSLGFATGAVGTMLRNQQPEKVRPYLETMAAPAVGREVFNTVPQMAAALARRNPGQDVSFDDLVAAVEAIPGKGRAMASYMRGDGFHTADSYKRFVDLLPDNVTRPGVAAGIKADAAKKRATDQADIDVRTDPENVKKEAARTREITAATERGQADVRYDPKIVAAEADKKAQEIRAAIPAKVEEARKLLAVKLDEQKKLAEGKPADESDIRAMRGEFTQQSKDFNVVRDAYAKIESVASKPGAAAAISLVYGFMKLQDPNSTVREGEYATAQNAGGIPEWIRNIYNKSVDGDFLTPSQRADFKARAKDIFKAHLKSHTGLADEYRRIAKERNITPSQVIIDYVGDYRSLLKNEPKDKPAVDLSKESTEALKRRARGLPPGG